MQAIQWQIFVYFFACWKILLAQRQPQNPAARSATRHTSPRPVLPIPVPLRKRLSPNGWTLFFPAGTLLIQILDLNILEHHQQLVPRVHLHDEVPCLQHRIIF